MNDEIKEILEETRRLIDNSEYKIHYHYCIHYEVEYLDKLLDYITNLQQERDTYYSIVSQKLTKEIDYQRLNELQQENERLKRILDEIGVNPNQVLDYKSRCEKASDKINYYKYFISLTKSEEHMLNTLDDILQNGSDSQ